MLILMSLNAPHMNAGEAVSTGALFTLEAAAPPPPSSSSDDDLYHDARLHRLHSEEAHDEFSFAIRNGTPDDVHFIIKKFPSMFSLRMMECVGTALYDAAINRAFDLMV